MKRWIVEVWDRPWSSKARTQAITSYIAEGEDEASAIEQVRSTLPKWRTEIIDQIIIVGDAKFPVYIGYKRSATKREGAEPMPR